MSIKTSSLLTDLKRKFSDLNRKLQKSIDLIKDEVDNKKINIWSSTELEEQLECKKKFFSKLKFVYLEQKTRDVFFDVLLDNLHSDFDQPYIDQIEKTSNIKKKELKSLKNEMKKKMEDLQNESENMKEMISACNLNLESIDLTLQSNCLIENDVLSEEDKIFNDVREIFDILYDVIMENNMNENELIKFIDEKKFIITDLEKNLNEIDNEILYYQSLNKNDLETDQKSSNFFESNSIKKTIDLNNSVESKESKSFIKYYEDLISTIKIFSPINEIKISLINNHEAKLSLSFNNSNVSSLNIFFTTYFKILKIENDKKNLMFEEYINNGNYELNNKQTFLKELNKLVSIHLNEN